MDHTKLLNELIVRNDYKTYLEIGVQNPYNNFDKIKLEPRFKHGVDPDPEAGASYCGTSDAFFSQLWETWTSLNSIDLIFIDGLHHADQVRKDFENALYALSAHGSIVIHDCLPKEERTTHVPRNSKMWHGDVYKFVMTLGSYRGVNFKTYDFDEGCCVVTRDENQPGDPDLNKDYEWQDYLNLRGELMRITEWQ